MFRQACLFVRNVYRTLLKFTLPTIGTESQVIDAQIRLIGYPVHYYDQKSKILKVQRITEDWDETTANWNSMNDKFSTRAETVFRSACSFYYITGGEITPGESSAIITSLVKEWYEDTPNYGVMISACDETYQDDFVPKFFSKNNLATNFNPKPLLQVIYSLHHQK